MTDEFEVQQYSEIEEPKYWLFIASVLVLCFTGMVLWWFVYYNRPDEPLPVVEPTQVVQLPPTETPTSTPTRFVPDTPTPLPTNTPTPTATVTELPASTPFHTPTHAPTLTNECVGVVGGDFYVIQDGDSLWSIWMATTRGCVDWSVWVEAALEENDWITSPGLIHPTGETGFRLWLPLFEAN